MGKRALRLGFLVLLLWVVVPMAGCKRGTAEDWAKEAKVKQVLSGHSGSIAALAVSPKEALLVSADSEGKLLFWELKNNGEKKDPGLRSSRFFALGFSDDGKYLAAAGRDQVVFILDPVEMKVIGSSPPQPDQVLALVWSPYNTLAASSCTRKDPAGICLEGRIAVFKMGEGIAPVKNWPAHEGYINALAFSKDGKYLASGGMDNKIILWDPDQGAQLKVLGGHEKRINALLFSRRDPNLLFSASLDGSVRVWDVAQGKELNLLYGQQGEVYGLALSPNGKVLASGGREPKVVFWNPGTGDKAGEISGLAGQVMGLGFSSDGQTLAAGLNDGSILLIGR